MQFRPIVLSLAALAGFSPVMYAQAPAGAQTTSAMLQPSLDGLHKTIQGLHLDKWKGGSVRAEAERNIGSIMQDLEGTLPPLLQNADAAPASVSAALPALRNIDALYDVVLRVFDAARVSAPGDQVEALQQAMNGLEGGRRSLMDHVAASADAREKQVADLQTKLKTQVVPVCPAPPPAPVCPTPKKAVRKRAKPAAGTQSAPSTGTTTPKPNQ
jgi:hypothetical protein